MSVYFESSEEVESALSNDSVQKLLTVGLSLGKQKSYTDLCLDLKPKHRKSVLYLVSDIVRTLFTEAQVNPRADARKYIMLNASESDRSHHLTSNSYEKQLNIFRFQGSRPVYMIYWGAKNRP